MKLLQGLEDGTPPSHRGGRGGPNGGLRRPNEEEQAAYYTHSQTGRSSVKKARKTGAQDETLRPMDQPFAIVWQAEAGDLYFISLGPNS